jgi:hypothetical protein
MPRTAVRYCIGREGAPCRFSTIDPGKQETVGANDRCAICGLSANKTLLAATLAHVFVLDYDIYRAAVACLPSDKSGSRRARVMRCLKSMCPAPTATARRIRTLVAVDRMLDSILHRLPIFIRALNVCARQIMLCDMVRQRMCLPQEVLQNICGFLSFKTGAMLDHLTRVKFRGYCLCRHSAFRRECAQDDPFIGVIYRNMVSLHKEKVLSLRNAAALVTEVSRRVCWEEYRSQCQHLVDVAIAIGMCPELLESRQIAHEHFYPRHEL